VTRVFGLIPALVRADLSVRPGEVVLVRGPNGAGKSTLLRVIATVLSPTYGRGTVLGFDLISQRQDIRRRAELIGHRTRLYEDLTGEENLRFGCRMFGLDPTAVPAALERVGLREAAGQRVRGYSQGMRQRAALARALLREPELLLLDEPYAGLDAEAKEIVDDTIREAHTGGRTVVVATHDQSRAADLATRVVFMESGRVMAGAGSGLQGTPA
jgi:ABC-type multidrug transport system ATPase subunit